MNKKGVSKRKGDSFLPTFFHKLFVGKISHNFFFLYRIDPAEPETFELYDFVKFGCNPMLTDSFDIAFRAANFNNYSVKLEPSG